MTGISKAELQVNLFLQKLQEFSDAFDAATERLERRLDQLIPDELLPEGFHADVCENQNEDLVMEHSFRTQPRISNGSSGSRTVYRKTRKNKKPKRRNASKKKKELKRWNVSKNVSKKKSSQQAQQVNMAFLDCDAGRRRRKKRRLQQITWKEALMDYMNWTLVKQRVGVG